MRTVFFIPALSKMSGGLAAIYELAEILSGQGRATAVCSPSPSVPGLETLSRSIERLPWDTQGGFLDPGDLWCIPESWPNALAPGANAGARVLVYVQNWIFMMTALPSRVQWSRLPAEYLAVSEPVRWFMREVAGVEAKGLLPAAVAPVFFEVGQDRTDLDRKEAGQTVRVAWMPRKNRALAQQMRQIALSRLSLHGEGLENRVEFVEIMDKSQAEVAELLAGCAIFLSSGFPEGLGLPPLESMATGCVPVGFSGLGGFEYMRNPQECGLPGLSSPPFALPEKPWGANGLFVSDGDVLSGGLALARAVHLAASGSLEWRELQKNARLTAAAYTRALRAEKANGIWRELE